MDRGAWWSTVHGVAKSQKWLSTFAHTHLFINNLKIIFLIFNWRIIALQCCVGFCHTIFSRHKYTYIPSLLSLLFPCPIPALHIITEQELPLLYSNFLLAIYFTYSNVYISISLNFSYPLLPHCAHVCSLYLCLYSCPTNRFISTTFLDSIYMC